MRLCWLIMLCLALPTAGSRSPVPAAAVGFDDARVGQAPTGWICTQTGTGAARWSAENGRRTVLDIIGRTSGYGVKEPLTTRQWHTLRIEFNGPRFKVRFNGKTLFEVEDATFREAGLVGVWTKADSVTRFDDFAYGGR